MSTSGERFSEAVRDYLYKNRLFNSKGDPSLGRINGKILGELYDRFEAAEKRRDKAEREKRMSRSERDKLYEALAEGCGCDVKRMTEAEIKKNAVAISAIIRATPDVTPADVLEACVKYRALYPTLTAISPTAVSGAWSRLADPKRTLKKGAPDWTLEPKFDWVRVVALRWPRERFPDRQSWEEDGWSLVPSHIKQTIHSDGPTILASA